jgi:hypothetical protein
MEQHHLIIGVTSNLKINGSTVATRVAQFSDTIAK